MKSVSKVQEGKGSQSAENDSLVGTTGCEICLKRKERKEVGTSMHWGVCASEEQWLRKRGTRQLEGKNVLVRDANPWYSKFWREHIALPLSHVIAFLFDVLYFFLKLCFEDYFLSFMSLKLQNGIILNSSTYSGRSPDLRDALSIVHSS